MTQSPFEVLARLHQQLEAQLEDLAHTYSPEDLARLRTIIQLNKELGMDHVSGQRMTDLIDEIRRLRREHDEAVDGGTS